MRLRKITRDRLLTAINRPFALAVLAAACFALIPSIASAQQRTFYLDRIQLSGAPDDGFVVWRPYQHEKTRIYGSTALGYTLNPLRINSITEDATARRNGENPVAHQLIHYFMGGIELGNRFAFGLSLPVAWLVAGGEDPLLYDVGGGLNRNEPALHDLRLNGRVKIYEGDDRKFKVGAGAALWFPTGSEFSFGSDDGPTFHAFGNIEYDFDAFWIGGQLGPHFRPGREITNTEGDLDVGSELRWAAGIFFPLRDGSLRLGGELFGSTGIVRSHRKEHNTFFRGSNTDLEWLASVRAEPFEDKRIFVMGGGGTRLSAGYGAPDLRLLAQIGVYMHIGDSEPQQRPRRRRDAPVVAMYDKDTDGDGYPDDIDMCPTIKEDGLPPDPSDGCPAPKDRDGDGIMDDEDKCPDEPEDKDGVEDYDGCPETDADGDGIPDAEDACPTKKGVANKDPKKHGCPKQQKKIIETESGIQLLEPIQFEFAKSTIKEVSYPILDEVVEVLQSRPEIRMAVHGHTDSTGGHALNIGLSRDRARSVMNYLVAKGIKRNRLESQGFGPDQPVATNDTEEGRAKNRRVEFKIIQ